MFNVNVRCLDDFDLRSAEYSMATFDGQNWEDAFTAMQAQRK